MFFSVFSVFVFNFCATFSFSVSKPNPAFRSQSRKAFFANPALGGKTDFRPSSSTTSNTGNTATMYVHPVLAVDAAHASFLDDAFSLSPDTGELMIHITDVMGELRKYPPLMEVKCSGVLFVASNAAM
jgi:hypothetical protein